MNESDLAWALPLFRKRYPQRYDQDGAEGWFRNIVLKAPLLFYPARTDHAFVITMQSSLPWLPSEWTADVVATCAEEGAMWEVVQLLRRSVEWSRQRRLTIWRICSETDYDIEPLARRMGASSITPRYILRL